MFRFLSTLIKIAIASLVTGLILHQLDLSAEQVLLELGLTPESVLTFVEQGVTWTIPHLILGALVIVPVWLVVYLFRPPRG